MFQSSLGRLERVRVVQSLVLLAILFCGSNSYSQTEKAGTTLGTVESFFGAYTKRIPIEVPAFHGIEPQLELSYNSLGGNGLVGVGWELAGFSAIARVGRSKGAPRYDFTDEFTLDGDELTECPSGSVSPACRYTDGTTSGVYYATKLETYQRIKFDTTNNHWTVWKTDGTRMEFSPVFAVGGGFYKTLRWGLNQVLDVSGNAVNYSWWCESGLDCYPDQVSYNGVTLTFYRDLRPDIMSFAITEGLGRTNYRLKSVKVEVNATGAPSLLRAYKLTYKTTSPRATNRSLLASVQTFGRAATVDPDGNISGPSVSDLVLPATTFEYTGETLPSLASSVSSGLTGAYSCGTFTAPVYPLDINGDGCTDFLATDHYSRTYSQMSNCDGTFSVQPFPMTANEGWWRFGDFNGDGRTDVATIIADAFDPSGFNYAHIRIYISNGDNTYRAPYDFYPANFALASVEPYALDGDLKRVQVGDFDGDGTDDIAMVEGCDMRWICDVENPISIYFSNGDSAQKVFQGFAVSRTGPVRIISSDLIKRYADVARIRTGDFNGDGKTDFIAMEGWDTTENMSVYLSNGDGTFTNLIHEGPARLVSSYPYQAEYLGYYGSYDTERPMDHARLRFGDFNGDGKTDLALIEGYGMLSTPVPMNIYLSLGGGHFAPPVQGPIQKLVRHTSITRPDPDRIPIADFNGDGRTDIGSIKSGSPYAVDIYLAQGNSSTDLSFGQLVAGPASFDPWCAFVGDFNGDLKTDIAREPDGPGILLHISTGESPDLLREMKNGYGAVESVSYLPSSHSDHTINMPIVQTVSSVTVNPGGGQASGTVDYVYHQGKYEKKVRRFLGFAWIDKYLPQIAGESVRPIERMYFTQDARSRGVPTQIVRCDGAGGMINQLFNTVAITGGVAPFFTRITATNEYSYASGGAVACGALPASVANNLKRRVAKSFFYDYDGNLAREINFGDLTVSGDEKTIEAQYFPNTQDYILRLPAAIRTYQGVDTQGQKLAESLLHYDYQSDWQSPPVKGLLTKTERWLSQISQPTTAVTTSPDSEEASGWVNQVLQWIANVWSSLMNPRQLLSGIAGAVTGDTYVELKKGYDPANGNLLWEENEEHERTTYTYDRTLQMFIERTINPLHQVTRNVWDLVCGLPTDQYDLNDQLTHNAYDNLCRIKTVQKQLGYQEEYNYCTPGSVTNPCEDPLNHYVEHILPAANVSGNLWKREYQDGFRRAWKTTAKGPASAPIVEVVHHDARGNVADRSHPYYEGDATYFTQYQYDALGRQTKVTHPGSTGFVTRTYAATTTTTTDELSHPTRETTDAYGRRVKVEKWHNGAFRITAESGYDLLGNLTSVKDADGNLETYWYDTLNRRVELDSPNVGTHLYTYDNAGRKITETDALSQVTRYDYDDLGRVVTKTSRYGRPDFQVITYGYDEVRPGWFNIGRRTSMTDMDPSNVQIFNYDRLGRTTAELRILDGLAYPFQRGFDSGGRVLWTRYPDGDFVGSPSSPLLYDNAGRLTTIPAVVYNATCNAAGKVTSYVNQNGTTTERQYSPQRQWITRIRTYGGSTLQDLDYYDIDAEGKVRHMTDGGNLLSYDYDELHQLTSATYMENGVPVTRTYDYELNGNIRSDSSLGTYVYHPAGSQQPYAVQTIGGTGYAYDSNGNMYTRGSETIVYDGENRVVQVGADTIISYDADGRRSKKTYAGSCTRYIGDNLEINQCRIKKYITIGELLVAQRTDTTNEWLQTDHLDSVQSVASSGAGLVLQQRYRPFGDSFSGGGGAQSAQTLTASTSRKFASQRQDENGLIYLRARYYDPSIGRFISPNPVGRTDHPASINSYAYAMNDPINQTDNTGMDEWWVMLMEAYFKDYGENVMNLASPINGKHIEIDREYVKVTKSEGKGMTSVSAELSHNNVTGEPSSNSVALRGRQALTSEMAKAFAEFAGAKIEGFAKNANASTGIQVGGTRNLNTGESSEGAAWVSNTSYDFGLAKVQFEVSVPLPAKAGEAAGEASYSSSFSRNAFGMDFSAGVAYRVSDYQGQTVWEKMETGVNQFKQSISDAVDNVMYVVQQHLVGVPFMGGSNQ
ncbi:MAG: FG-GAP-like repeat-containing protein [Pseudomonadota bacterium]